MASYQDIDSRLRSVEDFLLFVAQAVTIPVVTSALDPTPQRMPLGLAYRLFKQNPQSQVIDAEVVEKNENDSN